VTPGFRHLTLEVDDGVADVRLGDETGTSRMNEASTAELLRVTELLGSAPDVRAIVIRPRGRDFSAGGDITMFGRMLEQGLGEGLRPMIDAYHQALERLAGLDVPIVAAVRGAVAGGGLGLICVADVVIAADDAVLTTGATGVGLTADGGITWYLPRLVGLRRAQELLLMNRRLSGQEALAWGLVTRVAAADVVDDIALDVARQMSEGPTFAYGRFKALLLASYDTPLVKQLSDEGQAMVAAAATDDATTRITAFLSKTRRQPSAENERSGRAPSATNLTTSTGAHNDLAAAEENHA
jgi:2-(1,2-epoxy-1,2-dihydrophenyl)acetyl-CoA isomerase